MNFDFTHLDQVRKNFFTTKNMLTCRLEYEHYQMDEISVKKDDQQTLIL